MEEEQVISLTYEKAKVTAELLLKALYFVASKSYYLYQDMRIKDRVFLGETSWNRFMKSIDPLVIKDLKNNEVNLEQFKKELEKYGIGFAFYTHSADKVSVAYSIKHKDIVEKSLTETLEKIINKETMDNIKKNPKEKTFEEKAKYYNDVRESIFKGKSEGVKDKTATKGGKVL